MKIFQDPGSNSLFLIIPHSFEQVYHNIQSLGKTCKKIVKIKMTGGTPEVRSVKINLIDFLHLTFDLIDF